MDIIIRYFISSYGCLVACVCVCVCVCLCVCVCVCCCCWFFFELEVTEKGFFLRVQLYIWAVEGHKVDSLSIRAQSFNS